MDQRKLIGFGQSSLVVSLPKEWIENNKLKKGDVIVCEETAEGIIFRANPSSLLPERKISIDVSGKSKERIKSEIVSAYICYHSPIEVRGPILEHEDLIRNTMKELTGIEIVEATKEQIVGKDFLDIHNISIDSFIRTMDGIVASMINDARKVDEKSYDTLAIRDKDLNRIFWLVVRAVNHFSIYPKQNHSLQDLIFYKKVAENLEILADQQKRLARAIESKKLNERAKKAIDNYYSFIERDYARIMKAVYERDKDIAFKIEINVEFYKRLADETYKYCKDAYLVEFLKRSRSAIRGIARAVLNHI